MALPHGAVGCPQSVIVVFPDQTHLLFKLSIKLNVDTKAIGCDQEMPHTNPGCCDEEIEHKQPHGNKNNCFSSCSKLLDTRYLTSACLKISYHKLFVNTSLDTSPVN